MKKLFLLLLAGVLTSTTALGQISDEQIQKVRQSMRKHAALNQKSKQSNYKPSLGEYLEPEESTFGLHYSYSKHFPLGISWNNTFGYFLLGEEVGFNFKKERFQVDDNIAYDPKAYVTIAPGFYTNLFSISCGAGALFSKKYTTETTTEASIIEGKEVITTTSETKEKNAYNFMLRPNLKIFIPLDSDNEFLLALNAGYDYAFKFKETNGWHFGIGFQYTLE